MDKTQYFAMLNTLTRPELLRLCRAGGITAHRLKSDHELHDLLWKAFGRPAWERKQALTLPKMRFPSAAEFYGYPVAK